MATKPKKTKPSTKKKPITKKSTVKRKAHKSQKKSSFKKNFFIILGVFLMITFVVFGYYLGQSNNGNNIKNETKKKAFHKVEIKPKYVEPKLVDNKKKLVQTTKKPKLAILIDDVSTRSQMNAIKATGLKLTPSIFPPSKLSMTSHTLAYGLKHYMIHLPMESSSKQFNTQYKTLLTSMKTVQIENRVKELRKLFPTAKYVNNHTGSVFTEDYASMYILYEALRKRGFVFVDSKTIAGSKVEHIAKEFGDTYISRDIFIDNKHNIKYIHAQLKKAVILAKKNGYAIAIGHPHKVTMRALMSARKLLKDVELVYIDSIYKGK